ncbi:MAG: hypothetical protein DYG92_02305 [Leptolyngbya sp. PLA1]|nr:hypothetical protein [Leptolyngbya sp. PLA1]
MAGVTVAVGTPGGSHAAWAGPLDRGCVDRSAHWVVHVNSELLTASEVGRAMLADRDGPVARAAARIEALFGLRVDRDLLGLTSYGVGSGGTVTVLETTPRAGELGEHLTHAGVLDLRSGTEGGVAYLSWVLRGEMTYAAVRPGAERGRNRVVLCESKEALLRACAVLDSPPSGVAWAHPLNAEPRAASFVFAAVGRAATVGRDLAKDRLGLAPAGPAGGGAPFATEAMIFRAAEEMVLDVGQAELSHPEDGEDLYLNLRLWAENEETAQDCEAVIRGMFASVALQARERSELAPAASLARSVRIEREGSQLRLTTEPKVEVVVQFLNGLRTPREAVASEVGEGS